MENYNPLPQPSAQNTSGRSVGVLVLVLVAFMLGYVVKDAVEGIQVSLIESEAARGGGRPGGGGGDTSVIDITSKAEYLGNPWVQLGIYPNNRFPRNPWYMATANGQILFGSGDAIANVGTWNNVMFNPTTGSFETHQFYDVLRKRTIISNDEAVIAIRTFPDKAIWAGLDPISGSSGTMYSWDFATDEYLMKQYLPSAVHLNDIYEYDGVLFAIRQPSESLEAILVPVVFSTDGGLTWRDAKDDPGVDDMPYYIPAPYLRFIKIGGQLYLSGPKRLDITDDIHAHTFYRYAGIELQPDGKEKAVFVPESSNLPAVSERQATCLGATLFLDTIGSTLLSDSKTAWTGSSLATMRQIALPSGETPRAVTTLVKADGSEVCAIVTSVSSGKNHKSFVYLSEDGTTWKKTYSFTNPGFIRSATALDGTLYFGLGDWEGYTYKDANLAETTGNVYRYKIY